MFMDKYFIKYLLLISFIKHNNILPPNTTSYYCNIVLSCKNMRRELQKNKLRCCPC